MRALLSIIAASLLSAPLAAQGWIEPLPGQPFGGVEKVRTSVTVRVEGRIAHVEVEEWFENRAGGLGEGDYLYPLPGEAVFNNFSLFQGDQELRGETMDAAQARAIYEEIVRRKKDPALIELVGHGLIRSRVFPINPGETRKITLRYTQVMNRAANALQFRYSAGGRTGGAPPSVEGHRGLRPRPEHAPIGFRLVAENGNEFRDPFSPTHEVRVQRRNGQLIVRPDQLAGDFELFLPFADDVVGITLATHRPGSENGYFMLTLSPGSVRGSTLPRDITAVVDVSGSMSGEKLDQARAALLQMLSSLGEQDRFRLIAFSNRVRAEQSHWSRATRRETDRAREWVERLTANGGTNIEGALAEAFRLDSREGRLPIVIFLTDGLPSVGEENPERLARQAVRDRRDTRVFAFGVGYDVNTYLLDRLSDAGRGTTQYLRPGQDVEEAVGQLVTKIQFPVLADLEIADAPVTLHEVYPERLPDLFAGEELVIFGRYDVPRTTRTGRLQITGRRNGRTEQFAARVSFPRDAQDNDFIPQLWASRKIGYLTQQVSLHGHDPELVEEIRETALRYGLLSEYTSYLVQEPLERLATTRTRGRQLNITADAAMPVAPAAASGALAVNAAEQARARREVRSQSQLQEAEKALFEDRHGGHQKRAVSGRVFVEKDGAWVDVMHGDSLRVVEIAPFSQAYFEVLEQLPELERYFKAFEEVLVAGAGASIKVVDGGADRLSPRQLAQLVKEFRG